MSDADAGEAPDVRPPPSEIERSPKFLAALEAHGVSEDTAATLAIYPDKIWHDGDFRSAICFPQMAQGQHVGNWYRFGDGKWKTVFHNKHLGLILPYNIGSVIDNDTVVIGLNPMEIAALHDSGYPCAITPPAPKAHSGLRMFPDRRDYAGMVDDAYERLASIKKFILALPKGGAGDLSTKYLTELFGPIACWRVEWDAAATSVAATKVAGGAQAVQAAIEGARGMPLKGIREFMEGELQAYRDAPRQEQFSVGLKALDGYLRWRTGQIVVVAGYPGDGKSSFISWIAVELAKRYGWKWAVCSPEHEHEDTGSVYAEQWARQPYKDYGLNLAAMSNERLGQAERWVKEHFFEITQENEDEMISTDFLLHSARLCKLRYGVKGLIVDPYNQLEHEIGGQREDQYVGQFMRRLRLFARHNDVMIFLCVHPPKLPRNKEGKRPVPTILDAAGGAHFANQAMVGFTVYRPDYKSNAAKIIVTKMKRKDQGSTAEVDLEWDKETGCFKGRYEPDYAQKDHD